MPELESHGRAMPGSTITIVRPNTAFGLARKLRVFIDGSEAGSAKWNEVTRFSVDPGEHMVQVKMDWCESAPYPVSLAEGKEAELEVTVPDRTLTRFGAMWFKPRRLFGFKRLN